MALDPKRLRRLFAAGAVFAVLVAAFFYLRGILKRSPVTGKLPVTMPAGVEKAGKGFTFTQSEGGKTLFTIRAASFQQYKEGGKAELHDVSIIVYGREENRSDQIYGSAFSYDPASGEVAAEGQVHIDLDASTSAPNGQGRGPAQETRNLIHVMTSGLTFNQKTGVARTKEKIEFRVPEASGSAVGATYDSHGGVLTLKSAVKIVTSEKQNATITSQSATVTREPRVIVLHGAKIEQPPRTLAAGKITVFVSDDNTVERIAGSDGVHAFAEGPKGFDVTAPQGELLMAGASQVRSGTLTGGVSFESRGDSPTQGKAGRVLLSFGPKNKLDKARIEDAVEFSQGAQGRSQTLQANAVDVYIGGGKKVEKAVTSGGPAQIVLARGTAATETASTVSAGQFEAHFNAQNRLNSVVGTSGARLVSKTPGQPDRVATGRDLNATFNPRGELAGAELTGDFHYQEGTRTATAERGHYNAGDETISLIGSPRVLDSGLAITADFVQLSRKSGQALARGNVKTTYNDLKPQPGGAMLSAAEPVHVTGATASASRGAGTAHYTAARLWQGENIVEAPSLTFDKSHRSLQAQGDQSARVTSVFFIPGKDGKPARATVTADRLSYVDSDRKAVYSGQVQVKGEDFTMSADTAQVLLFARGSQPANQAGNQLDRIVAQGDIQIQQGERKAVGSKLVYTGEEQKFVLTGVPGRQPSIFDAEHGQISGDSLTFFSHDGRVLVGSGDNSHSPTQTTRIRDASTK